MKTNSPKLVAGTTAIAAVAAALLVGQFNSAIQESPEKPAARALPIIRTVANTVAFTSSFVRPIATGALPLGPDLTQVLSFEAEMPLRNRLAAIHALPAVIRPEERARLLGFIEGGKRPGSLTLAGHLALFNDVLNVLVRQPGNGSDLRRILVSIQADQSQFPEIRDYALQHLASLDGDGPNVDRSVHWQMLNSLDHNLVATAMVHLMTSARAGGLTEEQKKALGKSALELAGNVKAGPARVTALQVCGELVVADAAVLVHELALSNQEPIHLRIAAVAALGDLGGAPERMLLSRIAADGNTRLHIPARNALRRIEIR